VISLNDFTVLGSLGRGAYGEVVLGRRKIDDVELAIKILDKKFLARVLKNNKLVNLGKEAILGAD
jgi:serine/threonine protein kinase